MPTLYNLANRSPSYIDQNGVSTVVQDYAETKRYTLDWSGELGATTITTSVWVADSGGIAITSPASTTTTAAATVAKTGGVAKNTVTASDGQIYVKRINVRSRPDQLRRFTDYGFVLY